MRWLGVRHHRVVALAICLAFPAIAKAEKDPHGGNFTLEEATFGLEGEGPLVATLETTKGRLTCRLFEQESPITVANFVGLARGVRAFRHPRSRTWVKQPYFDGSPFHRVIPGFMVQTGDISGTGAGDAGYRIPNEASPKLKFNRPGLMGMANRGPNTGSAQFFITEAAARHLDGGYTIFGACTPVSVVRAIARVKRDPNDKPLEPVALVKVTIERAAGAKRTSPARKSAANKTRE